MTTGLIPVMSYLLVQHYWCWYLLCSHVFHSDYCCDCLGLLSPSRCSGDLNSLQLLVISSACLTVDPHRHRSAALLSPDCLYQPVCCSGRPASHIPHLLVVALTKNGPGPQNETMDRSPVSSLRGPPTEPFCHTAEIQINTINTRSVKVLFQNSESSIMATVSTHFIPANPP